VSPSDVREMKVIEMKFFIEEMTKDLKNKDPFLTPTPRISL